MSVPLKIWLARETIKHGVLNTFTSTSFDAPSRDVCGWSMHCACAAFARRL